jgi:hypothetical protein
MKTKTHFAFRVDIWDDTGDSIVEHVAGCRIMERSSSKEGPHGSAPPAHSADDALVAFGAGTARGRPVIRSTNLECGQFPGGPRGR